MIHWPVKKLLEWYEHLAPGTTARRNHDDCPSGEDRRRRLYVSKSDDNAKLKVYCHNCGNGTTIDIRGATKLRPVVKTEPEKVELPPVWGTPEQPRLHPKHRLWLEAFGIKPAGSHGVYSASDMELVFPYDGGHQIRYFDRKPKWKIFGKPVAMYCQPSLLVCEDIISAGKWRNSVPNSGYICLLGHRPTLKPEEWMAWESADIVVVWLDNDKPSVIEAARDLATANPGQRVVLIEGGTDPKRYPKAELLKVHDVCSELVKSPPPNGGSYHVLKLLPPGQGVCA